MARLVTSGFEIYVAANVSGTNPPDGTALLSCTRETSGQRSGVACLRINVVSDAAANNNWSLIGMTANERGYWARAYVKTGSFLPNGAVRLLGILSGNNNEGALMNSSGQVYHSNATSTLSPSINDGNWHRIEVYTFFSATQANRAWELRLDGTTISSGTAQTTDSAAPNALFVGWPVVRSGDIYFDDVALNDDQGSSQNSWPGDGKVVLLVPTADSAIGTGWTLGTGTAISANSGSTAVKNTPPLGVADLAAGSDPKQIRNATANANVNYDATVTTYTAAGIGATDTINLVTPWVITAAPVSTGAKLGTVGVVSNPAITNVALSALGTAGAFWANAAAGTFATGWKGSPGTTTYAPSVTKGTAPVMRVTQVTSSTRIAMVCFMGIYVDYTPAAAATPTKPKRYAQSYNVAVRRAALR